MKLQGAKFSYVSDEATFKQLKVMNVHLFGPKGYKQNLGMIEMGKECDVITLLKLQNQQLKTFKVDPDRDCIGQTMDGAAVCTKCGGLSSRVHHICYDHGIHNCVMRVTTIKKTKQKSANIICDESSSSSSDETSDVDYDGSEMLDIDLDESLNSSENVASTSDLLRAVSSSQFTDECDPDVDGSDVAISDVEIENEM